MEYASLFETELGIGAVVASETGICRVVLPSKEEAYPVPAGCGASPLTERVAVMLKAYFNGVPQSFSDIPVDLGELTLFQRRILLLIRAIPYGEVRSYGEVASMAAVPGAARAIGGAMAANTVPVIIPCHRVIASDGSIGGFGGGLPMKRRLLALEKAG